ncbi:hypothetical protein [Agromyces ramosus]|uniref:Uncharacterized protein n=1 Tax=Agromyces ramosus TaxID=33879 RepID=A0ABU0R653_9MICO|nr:hypothetical protein [Agromyces ramosus]MDQ0893549.1 hypothetical protein [Agromyces ramosus]
MAEGETGLEPTIEISAIDYPEIARIIASGGDVGRYLESAGVEPDVFADDVDRAMALCAGERTALGGSLAYVVEAVGEVNGAQGTAETIIVPLAAAASLLGSLAQVNNDGLRLAECLEQRRPEAAVRIREAFELLSLDDDRLLRAVDELSAGA